MSTPGTSPASYQVMLIAGEASGDRLGAHLIQGLKKRLPTETLSFSGIGGPQMEAVGGFASLFPFHELSHMGLDVIFHLPNLLNRIRQTVQDIERHPPDLLVTIDAPEFSFRVAKAVAKARSAGSIPPSIRLIHCVAPSVWAWRPKRAQKIARFLDHLMVLLPFEPSYFQAVGLACTFVGHPLLQEPPGDLKAFWTQTGWSSQPPVLCLLPGSRVGEIKRLMPVFTPTVQKLQQSIPTLQVVLPTFERLVPTLSPFLEAFENKPLLVTHPSQHAHAMAASTAALAASGTVALELAYHNTPMVIAYQVPWWVEQLARKLLRTPYVSLVNIIANQPIVPECLQRDCHPKALFQALYPLFQHEEAAIQQRQALKEVIQHLQAPLAFQEASAEVLATSLMRHPPATGQK